LKRRVDKPRTLAVVRPNAGIAADYKRRLDRMIQRMAKSYKHWVSAAYRSNEPVLAEDELPAAALRRVVRKLGVRWRADFDRMARELAEHFAEEVALRSDRDLRRILKKGGMSVQFRMNRAMRDVLEATVQANVALIKSIPRQYHDRVEGAVMRSVQEGRDLETLQRELSKGYGITKRRAALITLDQNNKASSALSRARQLDIGVKSGIWVHSGGGKEPRPSHVKAGRERTEFDLERGWYDPHEKKYILPGQLIKCRCVWRPVIPGFH